MRATIIGATIAAAVVMPVGAAITNPNLLRGIGVSEPLPAGVTADCLAGPDVRKRIDDILELGAPEYHDAGLEACCDPECECDIVSGGKCATIGARRVFAGHDPTPAKVCATWPETEGCS